MSEPEFLPFALPTIGEEEIREVVDTLRGGWVTTGPRTLAFEKAFAEYVGSPYARAVSSCTAALHIALVAQGVGPGDEVVTSALTFAATGNVVDQVGAKPVFAEVDEATWNITAATIEPRLTERTRAVILVHYAGLPCDIESVIRLCRPRGIAVIEDAAHAVGARYHGRPIGVHGDAVAFSFYANKNMTTGEGGMLTTSSAEHAARFESLRLHGMSRDAWRRYSAEGSWRYDITEAGFKYNMGDISAALGLVQLRRLEEFTARRAALVDLYRARLEGLRGLRLQAPAPAGDRHAHHIFVVRLDRSQGAPAREAVIEALRKERIGFSVHFIPLHTMSHYRQRWGTGPGDLPVTERLGDELLSLPLYPGMPDDAIDRVSKVVAGAVRRAG